MARYGSEGNTEGGVSETTQEGVKPLRSGVENRAASGGRVPVTFSRFFRLVSRVAKSSWTTGGLLSRTEVVDCHTMAAAISS